VIALIPGPTKNELVKVAENVLTNYSYQEDYKNSNSFFLSSLLVPFGRNAILTVMSGTEETVRHSPWGGVSAENYTAVGDADQFLSPCGLTADRQIALMERHAGSLCLRQRR
jgi:hypothetical protein